MRWIRTAWTCPCLAAARFKNVFVLAAFVVFVLAVPGVAQTVKLSTTSLTFGNQVVGTTSKAKVVTLTNTGTATLTISSITTTGMFAQTNTCGSSVTPGAKCTISATFSPTVTGVNHGSVIITDNAPDSPQTITTTGTGVQPVALTPASTMFAGRTVGTTSSPVIFTLKNNLTTAVSITSISITGDFAQTNACGTLLAAAASCTINVTFTPTQTGTRTGTLCAFDSATNSPQTASLSGKGTTAGLVSIAVTPANPTINPGATQQFTATGTFNTGTTYDLTKSVVWSSSATAVATISNTSGTQGLATAVANGTTTIKAVAGSISGKTTLTAGTSLVSIAVTPAGISISSGTKQQYTATGTYSDGTTKDLTSTATWASSATNIATITSTGLATGIGSGSTTISATSGTISGSTSLTVTSATVSSIQVIPGNASAAAGTSQQFKAIATYTDGGTIDLTTTVNWTSSATNIASISNTAGTQGLATTLAAGSTTISATSGSIAGSTALTVTTATLSNIVVTPALASLPIGVPQQFTATGIFSDGTTQNVTDIVQWSSSAPTIATVSNSTGTIGVVSSVAAGSTTITATSGTVVGSTSLGVSSATLVSIAVTPFNSTLAAGTAQQFTATGTFSDNSTRDLTQSVAWSSTNAGVATITSGGWVTCTTAGTTNISAALGGTTGSANLTVSGATLLSIAVTPGSGSIAPGTTRQFTATGTFSDSTTQDITGTVHWSTSAGAVATASNTAGGQGLATAVASGTGTVNATLGGVAGSANLTVTTATLSSVSITPQNPSIPLGGSQRFTASGTFSDATVQDITALATWTSSTPAIAVTAPAGTVTSASPGTTVITASLSGQSGSSNLTVTSGLVSIAVTPSNPSIFVGMTQQFTATGTYSNGTTQDLTTTASWTSSNASVATISNTSGTQGLATGVAAGSVTITATSGSVSGTASLTVNPPSLVSISVSPTTASIGPGATQQFTATGNYSDGSTQTITTSVTWSSSNTAVATISNTSGTQGLATGVAAGSVTITATSGSVSGTASLTVNPPSLVSISVSPTTPSIGPGATQQFTATGNYSDGSTQTITTSVTWSSSNTAVATISNTVGTQGLATGVSSGTATISAVSAGVTGTATLTVTAVPNVWTQDPSPLGPPIRCFVTAPSGHLLACAPGMGVYMSTNGGSTWTKTAGTGLVDVHVNALFFTGSTLLAGTHDGVYSSTNEGSSWTKSSSGLPLIYNSTATVWKFASFGTTIYAGTQNGLYISQNAGQSWTASTGKLPIPYIRALAVDSTGAIFAGLNEGNNGGAATNNGRVFISRDGGNTWTGVGPMGWSIRSLCVTGQTIIAGSWRTPYYSGGVLESFDGGVTWTQTPLLPNYSPNDIQTINGVLYVATRESQMFSSIDNGKTFQQITTGSGAQFAIGSGPAGLLLGSDGIYLSANSGVTWSHQNLAGRSQVAQVLYGSNGTIYAHSMMFGISESTDNGNTWTYINNGIPINQQRGIHNNYILLNAQGGLLHVDDNNLYRYQNGSWTQSSIGSHLFITSIILLPTGDVLVGDETGCVFRSTDGGATFSGCTYVAGKSGGGILDIEIDSNNVLYTTEETTGAWQSTDFGVTWTFLGKISTGNLYSITPFNGGLYVAQAGGTSGIVFRYTGNNTWVRSDSGITSSVVYQLLVTPSGKMLALGDLEIDVSSDGQTWTKLVTGLPRLTNPFFDDVVPMQRPTIGPDGKVHIGISYGGYGIYSALIQ